jgi:hypothetical protein
LAKGRAPSATWRGGRRGVLKGIRGDR